MVKTVVNPHRYPTHVPYNSVFKLTFASSGQHEDLFSFFWLFLLSGSIDVQHFTIRKQILKKKIMM